MPQGHAADVVQARRANAEVTATSAEATMPRNGALEKLGAAPLGVTVVEEPLLLASCVTVEGCAPSADVKRKQIDSQPQSGCCMLFAQRSRLTDERRAARGGEVRGDAARDQIAETLGHDAV